MCTHLLTTLLAAAAEGLNPARGPQDTLLQQWQQQQQRRRQQQQGLRHQLQPPQLLICFNPDAAVI